MQRNLELRRLNLDDAMVIRVTPYGSVVEFNENGTKTIAPVTLSSLIKLMSGVLNEFETPILPRGTIYYKQKGDTIILVTVTETLDGVYKMYFSSGFDKSIFQTAPIKVPDAKEKVYVVRLNVPYIITRHILKVKENGLLRHSEKSMAFMGYSLRGKDLKRGVMSMPLIMLNQPNVSMKKDVNLCTHCYGDLGTEKNIDIKDLSALEQWTYMYLRAIRNNDMNSEAAEGIAKLHDKMFYSEESWLEAFSKVGIQTSMQEIVKINN
jgi:hypothetical protein